MKLRPLERALWASVVTSVMLGTVIMAAGPAAAGPGDPLYLAVTKTVSNTTPDPGEPFTYTIRVSCSEQSCVNAALQDALPPELAGYALQNVTFNPSSTSIPRTVTWVVDGASSGTAPAVVTADTALRVDFTGAITAPTGVGLQNGQNFTAILSLQVPDDLPPGTTVITNTATTSADNSSDSASSAAITVTMPERIAVDVTKSWTPASQGFVEGRPSAIVLEATNASNVPVDSLVVQEPQAATDGAAALAPSNPFTLTDFSSFSGFTMPADATTVQVDAYVFQAGAWSWVEGTAMPTPELPAGVTARDVGGLRFTYEGGPVSAGASAQVTLNVTQRATDRTGADLSTAVHTVTNVVQATVTRAGHSPATATATATHTVNPATVAAATSKSILPGRIAAGSSADARIVATNASDLGVVALSAADLDYFTAEITFGGFTAPVTWPAGTESASVIYYPLSGGAPETVSFTDGAVPAAPAVPISGFEVVFASATGGIEAGASSTMNFDILTSEDAMGVLDVVTTTNSVVTSVEALNGLTDSATATDDLVLLRPAIDITLNKTLLPSSAVAPGERVVTSLQSRLTTTSDYVTASQIVVEDSWSGPLGFWDAFNLASFAPSQVPAGTSLVVEVLGPDTTTWVEVASFASAGLPYLAGMTQAELAAAVATATGGAYTVSQATGIRFTYDNATGFSGDTTVNPYVVSRARDTLRSNGQSTAPATGEIIVYENFATAGGTGQTDSGTGLSDSAENDDAADLESGAGTGPVGIEKSWSDLTVPAQSDAQRSTALAWSVDEGYERVTITDPLNAATPESSVFEAFNLMSVNAIAASSVPFSNGWYLKYDTVDSVELYRGGSWVTVPAPAGGWVQNGAFVGYSLTSLESVAATGVRISLVENAAARTAAALAGSAYDPYAPEVGSGVAASSNPRSFAMTWMLRDTMRGSGAWVTDTAAYNTADPGVVRNTVLLEAVPQGGGPVESVDASDDILLTNPGPGVVVDKSVSPSSSMYVPIAGTAAGDYPTAQFTIVARNNSVSEASYVRVMDSPVCTDVDPIVLCEVPGTAAAAVSDPFTSGVEWLTASGQGNPFDRFDLTGVTFSASIPSEVSLGSSTVWLLHYSAGVYSTTSHTAADVNAMDASQLLDVVGVSVTFQGADPTATGGTISSSNNLRMVLDTQLRTELRVSGAPQVLAANNNVDVVNRAFAQSFDPILNDGVQTGALDSAPARLTGGDINVGAAKSITPAALTEPTRDTEVTVTLGANQGTAPVSSLAPAEVRLTDDATTSPDFWNQFQFTGLGSVSAPAGADQVVVSVYGPFGTAGAMTWVASPATSIAAATVPVPEADYAQIQGVGLAFSRADGAFFSSSVPAANWSTATSFTAVLRDTYRDSGAELELAGIVTNTVTVISDRLNGESSIERAATAQINLSPGTYALRVEKVANEGNHTASAGETVPWDVTFTNAGSGFLTIVELRDTLPFSLVYLGDTPPAYTPDATGLLGVPSAMSQVGQDLVFTWPEGARTMAPGETFSVRLMLELQPGLTAGDRATNEMTVTTVETLQSCASIASGGLTTGAWDADPTTCGTSDYVTPSVGPNLFTVKGVRGALPGASNPASPSQQCVASLAATGGAFFRAPCAANSFIGGVDEWVLRAQNAGTTGLDEMVLFDALPAQGDRYLISGSLRGSSYRPQMLDDLSITAPAGTTTVIEVTTSPNACDATWGGLETQEPCEQNGAVWEVAGAGTDWSMVSAFKVSLDFTATPGGMLEPGALVDVNFSSRNVAETPTNLSGADVDVPVVDSYAWNQFGVKYLDTGATAYRKIAPARMGVHLLTGALQIDKVVTGRFASSAPVQFVIDVACVVDGSTVAMGEYGTLTLNASNTFTQTIEGIPFGATCVVTEPNPGKAVASFAGAGVTTLSSTSASVEVADGTAVVNVTNTYPNPLAFTGAAEVKTLTATSVLLVSLGLFLALRSRRARNAG